MPYFPRNSPTSGIPPELLPPPKAAHAPIPVAQPPAAPAARAAEEKKPARLRIGLAKLSPHTYQHDNAQALRTVFGKEPDVDPHTGELVPAQQPATAPVTLGNGG